MNQIEKEKESSALPQDTEQKIKAAAQEVFFRKGYHGAKVKDIAEAAGVNIALLNYYFRSKEQLFEQIFQETFVSFFGRLVFLLNTDLPLEEKITGLCEHYTDFLLTNPLVPVFILSEMQKGELHFFQRFPLPQTLMESQFARQLREEAETGRIQSIHPLHFFATLLGLLVFPVLAKPILSQVGQLDEAGYTAFLIERKTLVPQILWAYLRTS